MIPSGTIGAIAELRVSAHLLRLGYEVFRAVSMHCSCDLVISKSGKTARVEVKSRRRNARNIRADILAVLEKNEVLYSVITTDLNFDARPLKPVNLEALEIADPSLILGRLNVPRMPKMKPSLHKGSGLWQVTIPRRFTGNRQARL